MTKKQEIIIQVQSLVQLVSSKDFLTNFQKNNYNILIKNYQELAENFANDFDTWKDKYNKLAVNSPNKSAYKAKMEKAEQDLQPNKEALDQIEIEINTMEAILNKINKIDQDNQEIKSKLENLKNTQGGTSSTDLSLVNTKLDTLSEGLGTLTKGQEAAKNKKIADKLFSSQVFKDFETKSPNAFTTDPDKFIKACKEDGDNIQDFKAHVLLRQDPAIKLWGMLYKWRGTNVFRWASPNTSQDQETQQAVLWLKTRGINVPVSKADFGVNSNSDINYSFIWSLATAKTMANYWGSSRLLDFTEMKDEGAWKPQIEAEYDQYLFELSPADSNNCPCDIKGISDQIKVLIEQTQPVEQKAQQQRAKAQQAIDKTFSQWYGNSTAATADSNIFLQWTKNYPKPTLMCLWQDPITQFWGVVNAGGDKKIWYWSPNATYEQEKERLKNWLQANAPDFVKNIQANPGNYSSMNSQNSIDYSYKWALGILYLRGAPDVLVGDIVSESKWKPQIEAELKKYNELNAQIEIKQ